MIRNLCQSKWKLNRDYINFGEKNDFHGRMHRAAFVWVIMLVFFHQDIFKLSVKVVSLPLIQCLLAAQKHLSTPLMPQHRQAGQEKVPDSLVHRLIKVHSCQLDDRVFSSGITWSFFALHVRICICIHTMKTKFRLKKRFRPLLEAVKMSVMFLIRRASMSHARSLWEIYLSISRLILDSVVFTTTVHC